jgi:hypothetical protein
VNVRLLPAVALPVVLAGLMNLLPPGWGSKPHPVDSSRLRMPAALARGPRATGFAGSVSFPTRASVRPSPARLGQELTYHAHVIVTDGARATFVPPATAGNFTWGPVRVGREPLAHVPANLDGWKADSVWLEIPLQVFTTGAVAIPGPALTIVPGAGGSRRIGSQLPTVHLLVLPTVTSTDSNATLRPVRGPLGAPWWERVPWLRVAVAAMVLAILVVVIIWLRRRARGPVAAPATARTPVVARDPSAEALAALARLRAERLPEQERFGEHALALTRILRRYLEATLATPRPGDTSGELVARVRSAGLAAEDVQRLEGLLGLWDRVKFARAPLSQAEALRCESAVEQLVRRRERPKEVA